MEATDERRTATRQSRFFASAHGPMDILIQANGTADTTTWAYDAPSGLLVTKTDALGRAASQTYNNRGQTAVRTLARGVTTTYGYDNATGELLTQTYSDSTPAVMNAVVDALSHLGITDIAMPASPVRVWTAIDAARTAAASSEGGAR